MIRTVLSLIILLSVIGARSQNAKKLYKSGKEYSKLQNFERAVELYSEAIELNPEFSKAILARANAYNELSLYEKAASDYENLSELSPTKSEYFVEAGSNYFEAKNYQKAIPLLSSAANLDTKNSSIYSLKSKCYFELGNYPEALDEINTALGLEQSDDNYYQRGLTQSKNKNYAAAKKDLLQSIQINPNNANAYNYLAFAQFNLNELDQAIKTLGSALQVDNKNKPAYLLRSHIYGQQNKQGEAIRDLSKALSFYPNDTKILFQRGVLYSKNKQYNEAITDLSKVIKAQKEHELALKHRGESYEALNDKDNAVKDYKTLLPLIAKQQDLTKTIENKLFELQREENQPQIVIIQKITGGKSIIVPEGPDEATIKLKVADQSDIQSIKIDGFETQFDKDLIKSGQEIIAEIAGKANLKIEVTDVYGNKITETFELKRIDTGFPRIAITTPFSSKGSKIFLSELSKTIELQGRIVSKYKIKSIKIDEIPIDFSIEASNPSFKTSVDIENKEKIQFEVIDTEGNHLVKSFTLDKSDAEILSKNPMGRTWVVFVENSNYSNFTNLEGPKKEVNLMVKALENYQIDKVIHKKNMTKSQMDWYFKNELKKQIIDNRVNSIMVWYAGHGKFLNQKGYWIPVDSRVDDLSTYYNLNSLKSALKPYTKVITHSLIVTDACESGPSFYMSMRSLPSDRDCNSAKSTKSKSSQVFTSSGKNLADGDSQFTKSFANSLIYNDKSCVPIEKIANKVSSELVKTSNQRPKFGKISGFADENGSFIFIKK